MNRLDMPSPRDLRHEGFAWLLVLPSFAVFAAMNIVQSSLVSGRIEVTIRFSAFILGFAGVPVLLSLASKDWRTRQRPRLSHWRNGFGLGSIVVLSAAWLVYWGIAGLAFSGILKGIDGADWVALVLCCIWLGLALGFALQGNSRPQAISAALLMWASVQASIYF